MVTPDLEQLADEAIEARTSWVESRIGSLHIPASDWTQVDHLQRTRDLVTGNWNKQRPALAQLADDRLAAITRLAEQGITPEDGCTVTVGRVTLEAVRDLHPVGHRYRVKRGREQVGWAWLSSTGAYTTTVALVDRGAWCTHGRLVDALTCPAEHLNAMPLTEAVH